jgi:hypothetical protein
LKGRSGKQGPAIIRPVDVELGSYLSFLVHDHSFKLTLGAWTTMIFARLKDLAPYAVIELLLPGGSVLALTLWLYRRRKRAPALTRSLNALL